MYRAYPSKIALTLFSVCWEIVLFHKVFKKLKGTWAYFSGKAYHHRYAGDLWMTNRRITFQFHEILGPNFTSHLPVLIEGMINLIHFCKFKFLSPAIRGTENVEMFSKSRICSFISFST